MWYKVKRIMVWDKQVRPSWWKYSYDFRNRTQAQVEADWWTVYTPYNSDADGWYCSPPGALERAITDLTNAKKITINTEAKLATGSSIGSIWWAFTNGGSTAIYQFVSWNTSGNKGTEIYNNWAWESWTWTSVSWWANSTLEVNLLTYEIKAIVVNNWVTQTATSTATAATINAIIANPTFLAYPDTANHRLKTVQITIEQ